MRGGGARGRHARVGAGSDRLAPRAAASPSGAIAPPPAGRQAAIRAAAGRRQRSRHRRPAERAFRPPRPRPSRALPEPTSGEWPFPSNFSRTSGTGLLSGGASLWTDFVYDDHGPLGSPVGIAESSKVSDLAPVHGGFVYPEGPADNNGADIFRAAVGYSHSASYWRVDWNTLADADVPIAEWTFSTDRASDARPPAKPGPPTPA